MTSTTKTYKKYNIVFLQSIHQLLDIVLLDNNYLIYDWISYKIFKKTTGIVMRINYAVYFTNLFLIAFEIHNYHVFNLYYFFISCYINDIFTLTTLSIEEIHNFLYNFYKYLI
jgi:hypothetical protein